MERDLTIAEAARTFAEVVERVRHGESARVMEGGQVVARIVPAAELRRYKTGAELAVLWDDPNRPRLTPEEAEEFEADLKEAHDFLRPLKDDPWE